MTEGMVAVVTLKVKETGGCMELPFSVGAWDMRHLSHVLMQQTGELCR